MYFGPYIYIYIYIYIYTKPFSSHTHIPLNPLIFWMSYLTSLMIEPFQLTYIQSLQTHQYLHMNSCHPNHVEKAISFSQATRILRICSDPATALSSCNELIEYLVRRGHGRIRAPLEVQRAIDAYRNPQKHIRNIDSGVYFIEQYRPGLADIKGA